jgi:hypothetical protein
MWLNNIFKRESKEATSALFDEVFLRRLERLSFRTAPSLRGVMAGERRSRNLRPALDFSDHRAYTRGDDLRYIDWKTYSRHEELFVKLGEAPQSVNVHILVDCSRSMSWVTLQTGATRRNGSRASILNKWDAARRLAGALSYLSLSGGERLFITPFTPGLSQGFGPTQGKRQIIPALKYISSLTPVPPSKRNVATELTQSLTTYAHSHPQGGLLIIISDLLDAAASAEAGQGADWLAEGLRHLPPPRWQVIVMHMLSEQEVNPDFEGDFDLQDMETGERLPFRVDRQTLSQYRLRVRRWCGELQAACGQRAAIYARVLAEWPFERMVIPYLRQRGAVQ